MRPKGCLFDEQVASHYEAWYETPEGRQADRLEKALLRKLLQGFPQARSVLEVGSGTGHFTRWLAEQDFSTAGLDLAPAMVAQAQSLDGLPFICGDAHRLPFADEAFDLVAFITTLEFLNDPERALQEAARVTRQGLILGVLNRWSLLGLWRRLKGPFRPSIYGAASFYGVGELKEMLWKSIGRQVSIAWRTTLFPRPLSFLDVALPWGGFIGMSIQFKQEG